MNLKQLSESLGLSQTTVSRALNGYPEVREETRLRVQAAARAANYRPNIRAQRLAKGRAMAIGHVITPTSGQAEMVNPIFSDFLAGAAEVYSANGYDLRLSLAQGTDSAATYRAMVAEGSVDGVVVQGPVLNDPRPAVLQSLGLPFLVHGRSAGHEGYSWLDVANARGFHRATDALLDLGHRRIALINGPEEYSFAERRRKGFETAMAARGVPVNPAWLRAEVMTEQYGYRAAGQMLDASPAPTAFLVSSIIPAIGVRRAAGERGLRTGRDISIICHDDALSYLGNDRSNAPDGPAFTATRSSIRAAGRRCAEILLDLIDRPDQDPIQELWETDLILGRSTGPAPP